MIITLALGTWVGGDDISWASREIAIHGRNPFTIITPGSNLQEVLEIVRYFKNKYDQIVLVGYPPFIKSVIDEGEKQSINWKSSNTRIGLGGENYSEEWREYIRKKIGIPENDLMGIAGGYGAADVGMSVGREYPITVLIRKIANKNKKIAKDLFGTEEIPSLCQYSPSTFYIEEVNKELIFTSIPGIPIIRYNIHDRGGVIPFSKVIEILKSYNIDPKKMLEDMAYSKRDIWQLPFFYVFGRSDGAISIDGANVYPNNVEDALLNIPEGNIVSAFKLKKIVDENYNEKFYIFLELKRGVMLNNEDLKQRVSKLHNHILRYLLIVNREYEQSYRDNPNSADPVIKMLPFATELFNKDRQKIKKVYIE